MGTNRSPDGFALPTILISAVILLSVLVAAVGATVAIRTAVRDARYVDLASMAAEAGEAFAKACLNNSSNSVTWTDEKPLKPNTDCNGNILSSASAYVIEQDEYRTYFVVPTPVASNVEAEGYVEALRKNGGTAWRLWSSNTVSALSASDSLPVGTSLDGYWTSPPPGYLLEDGACVSQTIYADLYAVIGDTFKVNYPPPARCDSGEFNLPDSRGRVGVNQSTDSEFNALGKKSGAKTHTLTEAEMPSHTHIQNPHNHAPRVAVTYGGSAGNHRSVFATNSPFWSLADYHNVVSSATATNQNAGGDQPHNNLQPFIVTLRVIKY